MSELTYFLGIGAQRAGTSWLHDNLRQHPQLDIPDYKELHFFDKIKSSASPWQALIDRSPLKNRRLSKVAKCILSLLLLQDVNEQVRLLRLILINRSLSNIPLYFSLLGKGNTGLHGEITPAYATLQDDIIREIHRHVPTLKVIFVLRDPIERHWSMLRMQYFKRYKDTDAFQHVNWRMQLSQVNRRNDYLYTLRAWSRYFPVHQICVLFYDDLVKNPLAFLNTVCEFLQVSPLKYVPVASASNVGIVARMPAEVEVLLIEKYLSILREISDDRSAFWDTHYPMVWLQRALNRKHALDQGIGDMYSGA